MSWYLSPALVRLRSEIEAAWPGRSKVSDGSLGDQAHAARKSDHNPDPSGPDKGEVRAIDVTQWDPGTPDEPRDDVAEAVAEQLRASKDRRIKYVIWRGRMFSSYASGGVPPWTWRPYTGPNGHFHHVHISVLEGSGSSPWGVHRPAGHHVWVPFREGATDRSVYAAGGLDNEVSEVDLILTRLAKVLRAPDLDPRRSAHPGEYRGYAVAAVRNFKRRIIRLQRATGQPVWPNTDDVVGPSTIGMLRWWNGVAK